MKALLEKIRQILKNKRTRRIFTRYVSAIAAIIVFVTTYAMVLPAITMEKEASCGIEEHQHDDSCYEERLICGQEESEGHHHDDSCYEITKKLVCDIEEHQHSVENGCYDADGNLICQKQEHIHDDSCYEEVKKLICGQEESEGHHHTDACYEKVLVCGKEAHTHSAECYKSDSSAVAATEEAAGSASTATSGGSDSADSNTAMPEQSSEDAAAGMTDTTADAAAGMTDTTADAAVSENYVPTLDPLNMDAVLNKHTDFYYFHAEDDEEVPANSADITDWQQVKDETELASTDLVKMYLSYTIPAGSLNETNPTARYRLPENVHLTDDQIKAINKNENGVAAGYKDSDTEYKKYLGAEAVEGDRKPDEELKDGAEEYISAVVKAENVYKDDQYVGQDLIFTFVPYTIEKNQNTYDADGSQLTAGKKVTGWFACDFALDQIDWVEKEQDLDNSTIEKNAEIVFVEKDSENGIKEISKVLNMTEDSEADRESDDVSAGKTAEGAVAGVTAGTDSSGETGESSAAEDTSEAAAADTVSEAEKAKETEYKSGTLTDEGDGYNITLDYTEEAKIPENAELSVKEITAETDKEAYDACLEQARQQVTEDDKSTVDQTASRFFDIEIVVKNEQGEAQKIEPAAPVSVNIQISDASKSSDASSETGKTGQKDPTVLHFAEEGVEQIDSTVKENSQKKDSGKEQGTEVQFEAESFSVYGVVYTVDFHYEVNGKTYDFSIPGGSYISMKQVVEALGIAITDENSEKDASVAAKEFVESVTNVVFSNPELVSVSKVEEDTTVKEIKDSLGLECEYSANLTEEQIEEINAQTVEAGDWALISLQPFITEEKLTITMENEDQFVIRVTDAAISSVSEIDTNKEYVLYTVVDGVIHVLKTDGGTATAQQSDLDGMDNNYKWKFVYVYKDGYGNVYYIIRPCDDNTKSIALNWDSTFSWDVSNNNPLVQQGNNNIIVTRVGNGFKFEGYNTTKLVVENGWFAGRRGGDNNYNSIVIYEQGQLSSYKFAVRSDDYSMGKVVGKDENGVDQSSAEYDTVTNTSLRNQYTITAEPQSSKYLFDYWDLNGTTLNNGATISVNSLEIPYQGSTLTAHFKRNPNWQPTEDEKEGRTIDKESLAEWLESFKNKQVPLDQDKSVKTAEVYDYENRIYRVDMTAQSNLETFDGIVDLGFILDVSGSMKFPSRLKKIESLSDVDIWRLNEDTDWDYWGNPTQYYWQEIGLDDEKTYYIIAEKSTRATVFRIFYDDDAKVWKRVDASYYPDDADGKYNTRVKTIGNTDATFGVDAQGTHYPFYEDDDYPKQRRNYEQDSLDSTITELNSIINMLSLAQNSNSDPNVKVAWNTFCKTVNHRDHTFKSVKNKNDINIVYTYEGGTRTDSALQDARSFNWESSATKYAILITDGAPQYGSNQAGTQDQLLSDVRTQADALKKGADGILGTADDVTLLTIGLSMKDVKVGSVLLYDIASTDANGDPYFYSAESGDELQYILYEIIQKIVKPATVKGDVTDTVNEAFYPVDKNTGAPLDNNVMIDLEGNITTDESKPHGTVIRDASTGYTYQIKWSNQEFPYGENWHGTVYVKAKEDFLGGNAVRTNASAEIQANSYKVDGSNSYVEFNNATKTKGHKVLEIPRVNVNELHFNHNSSEWTVYLGTEVNPKDELKKLYNSIVVDEVITTGKDTDGNSLKDMVDGDEDQYCFTKEESILDQRPQKDGVTNVTFPLKDVITLTDDDWNTIIAQSANEGNDNKGVTITYDAYGQDCPGTFNIKLTKDHDPVQHITDQTGKPVETYTLTVLFTPDYVHVPAGQGGTEPYEFYTGTYGTAYQGHAMGTEDSINVHKINVYAKPLDVRKFDDENNLITDRTATFRLLRAWTKADAADENSQSRKITLSAADGYVLNGTVMTGDYYLVEEKDTESGVAHFGTGSDMTKLLNASKDPYYLIEWTAPTGYKKDSNAKTITVEPGDNLYKALDKTTVLTQEQIASQAYNWDQGVRVKVDDQYALYVNAEGNEIKLYTDTAMTQTRNYVLSTDEEGAFLTQFFNQVADKAVKLLKVGVNNTDESPTQTNLGGAKFTIYHATGVAYDTKGDVVVIGEGAGAKQLKDLVSQETTGLIWEGKLPKGIYLVEETDAPDGYNKLPILIRLNVSLDEVNVSVVGTAGDPQSHYSLETTGTGEETLFSIKIVNTSGVELPHTGGPGTHLFTILGGMLLAFAGAMLLRRWQAH